MNRQDCEKVFPSSDLDKLINQKVNENEKHNKQYNISNISKLVLKSILHRPTNTFLPASGKHGNLK